MTTMPMTLSANVADPRWPVTLIEICQRFLSVSTGRVVHEYITAPQNLQYPVGQRSKRLMRASRISLW